MPVSQRLRSCFLCVLFFYRIMSCVYACSTGKLTVRSKTVLVPNLTNPFSAEEFVLQVLIFFSETCHKKKFNEPEIFIWRRLRCGGKKNNTKIVNCVVWRQIIKRENTFPVMSYKVLRVGKELNDSLFWSFHKMKNYCQFL